jgi:hypothetical protein
LAFTQIHQFLLSSCRAAATSSFFYQCDYHKDKNTTTTATATTTNFLQSCSASKLQRLRAVCEELWKQL